MIFILLSILLALVGPLVYPRLLPPDQQRLRDGIYQDYDAINAAPSAEHWLGADYLGRDSLTRLLIAIRVSLLVAFVVVKIRSRPSGAFVAAPPPTQQYQGYICDTTHMVAFTQGLQYSVRSVGGLKSLFLSGEGLVCEFRGQGRLWMQTRNPGALASFLHPFRPTRSSS